MSKTITAIFLSALLASTPVAAADVQDFYNNNVGTWHIGGYPGDTTLAPACYAETTWQDGSVFQLIKDLATGELYIWMKNISWNIVDTPGEYTLRMNIEQRNRINGGNYYYQLINKNTIVIGGLNVDDFVPSFMDGTKIVLVMPGDIQNAEIGLDGSAQATAMLAECIQQSANVNLTVPKQNNNNAAPNELNKPGIAPADTQAPATTDL